MNASLSEEYITIDGIRTHVTQAGRGHPLVLIHGLGGPLMWQRVIDPLSQHFHVLVVDLPGFGDSDCPPKPFATEQCAEFIVHLLDGLSIQKATLIGISYGGQIGATVAFRYPERVEKLVLIASTGLTPNGFLTRSIPWRIISAIMKNIVFRNRLLMRISSDLSFYDKSNRPSDFLQKFYRQISHDGKRDAWVNCLRNILLPDEDFIKNLSTLEIPVLIIWGENDRTISSKLAFEFQKRIPYSKVKLFSECAHSVPLEKPKELSTAIFEFAG